jgi:hypothetical protein
MTTVTKGLWVPLEAKPGKEEDVARFLDSGRQAHLSGRVAEALMAQSDELLARPPEIQQTDVVASKLPAPEAD